MGSINHNMINYESSMGDMDIIFAGGGTAACVAAGRLAKASPDLKILLIEGGPNQYENPIVRTPALYLKNLEPNSKTALFYKSKASDHLNGREVIVPMGGCLGGGSSINFMMYVRGQAEDYDSWKTDGWYADDVLPLLKKFETFHEDAPGIDRSKHGYDGPIHVSDGGFRGQSANIFMDTIKEMGQKEFVDLQDLDSVGGFSTLQRYVSKDGKRQDAAHCYIHPLLQDGEHPNLHILCQAKVSRVIFDEATPPRAIGVEYLPNEEHQPALPLSKPTREIIKASKLVVVSAGALGTPQILERSGVGSPEVLKKADVSLVANLPDVGEHYQDHHLVLYPYKSSLESDQTLDGILSGREDLATAISEKNPILGWNGVDVGAKLRPTAEEVESLGPEFKAAWERDFEHRPTRPVLLIGSPTGFLADQSLVEPGQYFSLGLYTSYPYSRGSIHITNKDDVQNGYEFDSGFLSNHDDIVKHVWAYKMSREIVRRLPYYRGEVELGHPKFPEGSKAALRNGASDEPTQDLEYSKEDDIAIEDWIKGNVGSTWHSLGTCRMKPRDQGGVLDADLNVYGTVGLKVVDLSMVPENVGANTNSTALAVGEKAALIISREMGFKV